MRGGLGQQAQHAHGAGAPHSASGSPFPLLTALPHPLSHCPCLSDHVKTKTAVQIRSHAQKFFSKLEKQQKAVQAGLAPTIGERLGSCRLAMLLSSSCCMPAAPGLGALRRDTMACCWVAKAGATGTPRPPWSRDLGCSLPLPVLCETHHPTHCPVLPLQPASR